MNAREKHENFLEALIHAVKHTSPTRTEILAREDNPNSIKMTVGFLNNYYVNFNDFSNDDLQAETNFFNATITRLAIKHGILRISHHYLINLLSEPNTIMITMPSVPEFEPRTFLALCDAIKTEIIEEEVKAEIKAGSSPPADHNLMLKIMTTAKASAQLDTGLIAQARQRGEALPATAGFAAVQDAAIKATPKKEIERAVHYLNQWLETFYQASTEQNKIFLAGVDAIPEPGTCAAIKIPKMTEAIQTLQNFVKTCDFIITQLNREISRRAEAPLVDLSKVARIFRGAAANSAVTDEEFKTIYLPEALRYKVLDSQGPDSLKTALHFALEYKQWGKAAALSNCHARSDLPEKTGQNARALAQTLRDLPQNLGERLGVVVAAAAVGAEAKDGDVEMRSAARAGGP